MKTTYAISALALSLMISLQSCKKGEVAATDIADYSQTDSSLIEVSDTVSSVASLKVKDKQFIKTASVDMLVKNVYDATLVVEKTAQDLGGFVTHSELQSRMLEENTYPKDDENAVLVRQFKNENTMQFRIPTDQLGAFLTEINKQKLFLNSRVINAEDVTANIKYSELERQRTEKTNENIAALKTTKDKVKLDNENMSDSNLQKLSSMNITDQLKYSTVDVYITEPNISIAEMAVTNTQNIEDRYGMNFFYSLKNAFYSGYDLIRKIIIGIFSIWPLVIIFGLAFYFYRKNQSKKSRITTPQ